MGSMYQVSGAYKMLYNSFSSCFSLLFAFTRLKKFHLLLQNRFLPDHTFILVTLNYLCPFYSLFRCSTAVRKYSTYRQ